MEHGPVTSEISFALPRLANSPKNVGHLPGVKLHQLQAEGYISAQIKKLLEH
jgi:hypothetical protein